jgi:4-carboxymuconolactone decarboxylase
MNQTTTPQQHTSQQTPKTEVSPAQPTVGRFAEIPQDQWTPEQQEAYRLIIDAEGLEPGAPLPSAPLKIWISNPKLSKALAPLIRYLKPPHNSLSPRERELAVCIITSKWHTPYTIYAHEMFAKYSGMPPEMIDAVISGLPATFANEREQVIYEMATALANSRWISQGLHDRAVQALGHTGITDVTVLMGFYTAVSLTVGFYDVPAPGIETAQTATKKTQ